ncbi:MAG: hypothetical protein NW224_16880 [Leptolyngbyaceae cyanobacterium bins.302]|nr:hypothetical protein [Leptolyngbyaceae cyanobacterium bins.302]
MVYLLHFIDPISPDHTAQHYLGSADDWEARIEQHRQGQGARLCEVAKSRNIGFVVARLWVGALLRRYRKGRDLERALKQRKNSPRFCPICKANKSKAV